MKAGLFVIIENMTLNKYLYYYFTNYSMLIMIMMMMMFTGMT